MKSIRCSSLPMMMKCARSQDSSDLLIEAHHPAADLGTAAHDSMRTIVEGGEPDLHVVALRYDVDEKELRILVSFGRKAWEELRGSFPLPECELEVRHDISLGDEQYLTLTGHIDVLSQIGEPWAPNEARFLDWKSGRDEESDYYAQLCGYAACLILGHGCEKVTGTVVWMRSQSIETFVFTRADALAFIERLMSRVDGPRYVTGQHCAHCPRSHSCEALIEQSHRDIRIMSGYNIEAGMNIASPRLVVDLHRRVKTIQKFAESLEEGIRRRIANDGPLNSGDGYQLSLVEENGKRKVNAMAAWPILQGYLTDEDLANCVTVHMSKVEEAVMEQSPRGQKKARKQALDSELREAGAIEQETVTKLKEIRLPKETK